MNFNDNEFGMEIDNSKSQILASGIVQNKKLLEGRSQISDNTGTKHEGGMRSRHVAESSN